MTTSRLRFGSAHRYVGALGLAFALTVSPLGANAAGMGGGHGGSGSGGHGGGAFSGGHGTGGLVGPGGGAPGVHGGHAFRGGGCPGGFHGHGFGGSGVFGGSYEDLYPASPYFDGYCNPGSPSYDSRVCWNHYNG